MKPKIVVKDQFMVIGTEYIGKNENSEISTMWGNDFMPRIAEIRNVINPGIFYGICACMGDVETGVFSYVAGREVSNLDEIPVGMVGKTIPSNTYAVFTHIGPLTTLGATWTSIYDKWLPESGYKASGDPDFECYDERFKDMSEDSELDIYIPIKAT